MPGGGLGAGDLELKTLSYDYIHGAEEDRKGDPGHSGVLRKTTRRS